MQIFYPGWWQDANGNHPAAMTFISADDVMAGKWLPTVEPEWSRYYVHELELRAQKTLMIWPYHTMLGTSGHSITPALYEAITFHSEARRSNATYLVKGRIAKTEYYSILEPEVKVPEEGGGTLNRRFLKTMADYDAIYIAGQAKSHCVLETITSIARYDKYRLLEIAYLLEDCTSSVAHPQIDFDAAANDTLSEFEKRGLTRITSETAIRRAERIQA
jgi:nicotinamidase-related amidase